MLSMYPGCTRHNDGQCIYDPWKIWNLVFLHIVFFKNSVSLLIIFTSCFNLQFSHWGFEPKAISVQGLCRYSQSPSIKKGFKVYEKNPL